MKKIYKALKCSVILIALLSISCSKFTEVDPPIDRITSSTLFSDDATAISSVLGVYSRLSSGTAPFSNGATTIFTGISSDELIYTSTDQATVDFGNNNLAAGNGIIATNFWRNAYEIIYHANACIEGLESSRALTPALKKQLTGEVLFIRAFSYWHLINLFGDVPLITSTDYQLNTRLARTTSAEIIQSILSDLDQAKSMLTATYPSAGKVRINYFTVLSLLSRLYLYQQQWKQADDIATEIINSGGYRLETDLNRVFLIPSSEAIWQLSNDQLTTNTVEGSRFVPLATATIVPQYVVTQGLFNAFEVNDNRKNSWIASKTVTGTTYLYPFKYKVRGNSTKTEYYVVFRLAEQYLIRAEARANLNSLSNAIDDLDLIRSRAGLPRIKTTNPNISQAALLSTIAKERRIELFAEWGHRWFDLKRSGKINEVLSSKPNWNATDALFPIPASEILVNNKLVQNPGYN